MKLRSHDRDAHDLLSPRTRPACAVRAFLLTFCLATIPIVADATPIELVFTGTATGTLEDDPFVDQALRIVLPADAGDVIVDGDELSVAELLDDLGGTVQLGGSVVGAFAVPMRVWAEHFDTPRLSFISLIAADDPDFAPLQLSTPLAFDLALGVALSRENMLGWPPLHGGGDFVLDSGALGLAQLVDASFSVVVVPEPSAALLLMLGLGYLRVAIPR